MQDFRAICQGTEDKGLRYSRISILYSKNDVCQELFELICQKLNNKFTPNKNFKEGELFISMNESRQHYANIKALKIFNMKDIGAPMSLYQIESTGNLSIVIVYDFENYVGIHFASGS